MEKQAVINPENTPPERREHDEPGVKQASSADLEKHPTKRVADAVEAQLAKTQSRYYCH